MFRLILLGMLVVLPITVHASYSDPFEGRSYRYHSQTHVDELVGRRSHESFYMAVSRMVLRVQLAKDYSKGFKIRFLGDLSWRISRDYRVDAPDFPNIAYNYVESALKNLLRE